MLKRFADWLREPVWRGYPRFMVGWAALFAICCLIGFATAIF